MGQDLKPKPPSTKSLTDPVYKQLIYISLPLFMQVAI